MDALAEGQVRGKTLRGSATNETAERPAEL